MKHKLLSLFALAGAMFMSASVWAQDEEPTPSKWPDPVKPTCPVRAAFNGTWVDPVSGGNYYLYNVEAAQFLSTGLNWGTRATASADSVIYIGGPQDKDLGSNKVYERAYIVPFEFSVADPISGIDETLYFLQARNTSKGNDIWLVHEGNGAWIDGGTDRRNTDYNGWWRITQGENGYTLLPVDYTEGGELTDKVFGLDANNMGVGNNYTWTDLTPGASSYSTWKFIEATEAVVKEIEAWRDENKAYIAEAGKAYNTAVAIYNAKVTLHATLDEADALGVSTIEAAAIYLDPDATESEVLAANTSLQLAITLKGQEPPVDITNVLVNPDFEVGNINGWETNYVSGKQAQNIGYQGASYTNGDITISKFIESWLPGPATIGDGYLQQTIYGLPAGKYRLECDAIAVQQSNASATTTGAYLFIQAGTLESKTSMTSGNEAPEHFEVSFNNDGGKPLTFGMKTVSTSANWICADNFKLWYDGELTESPHYTQLKDYLTQVQEDYNTQDLGHAFCCQDSLTALDAAMLVADGITPDNSDDDCDAAYTALEKALAGVHTSIKVYQSLLAYTTLNPEGSKLAFYEEATAENKWDELSLTLSGLQEDFDNAYEEGTWSDDEVKTRIDGIIPSIITWVQAHPEALTKGNDLTLLLVNADFEEGTYFAGWDAKDDEVQPEKDYGTLPGWTISSGNITQMKHVIETYHRKFDFNQTIKNMPAGVYDITVQGFVRHDGSATDQTIFYAGDLENQLMLRSDQWSLTSLYDSERDGDPCGGNAGDQTIQNSKGEDVLVPNGMSGFYFWEKVENTGGAEMDYLKWKEGDFYYTNHIKATLNQPGDFTIGMKSLGNTDWIIWDNFQIIYIGDDASVYPEMAEEDFNALTNALNNTDYPTLKAKADYAEIAKEDYSAIATLEAYNAYKAKVDALIAYIQEGTKLGNTLHDLLSEYGEKVNVVMFDTSDFLAGHYSEYSANLENGTCPHNDYLSNAPDVLAIEWTQCAVKQANTALFNNLGDIIINPQYTTVGGAYTLDGWNLEKEEEVTVKNVAGEGVAEVYNPSGEYKFYQTIKGLKEGYYRVTVDAFFRPAEMKASMGREACVSTPSRAFLFAEGDKMFVTPIKNILVGHGSQEGVGSESTWTWPDETVEYTPNDVAAAAQYFNGVFNWEAEDTDLTDESFNQSVYRNALNAHVGEDGVLTIGITNYDVTDFVTNDWCCFSNWTLSLLGAAPDAIKGVSTKGATAPTAIFTIDGRQASRLQRGMNIVRQADGSVKKVLVK